MRRPATTRTLLVATLLAAVVAGCAGGGDTVDVEPGDTQSPTGPRTELTVELDETGSGSTRTWRLTCDPVGGDHPDPEAACRAVREAGGAAAFDPVPPDRMCTEIYGGPQVAVVRGTVDGTAVDATFTRTDGCQIARWDALAPLLGSTGGASGA